MPLDAAASVPMTDAARQAIRRELTEAHPVFNLVLLAVAGALVGAILWAALASWPPGRLETLAGLATVLALPLVAVWLCLTRLRDQLALRADLGAPSYLRVRGRVAVRARRVYEGYVYELYLDAVRLRLPSGAEVYPRFEEVHGATVELTRHGRLVLAIRGPDGREVYPAPRPVTRPEYGPDPGVARAPAGGPR